MQQEFEVRVKELVNFYEGIEFNQDNEEFIREITELLIMIGKVLVIAEYKPEIWKEESFSNDVSELTKHITWLLVMNGKNIELLDGMNIEEKEEEEKVNVDLDKTNESV